MAFTDDRTALNELSLSDLRQLPRDELEELVVDGRLEADRVEEIISDENQKRQEREQSDALTHAQAQIKKEEQQKDDNWLQRMSQSYQQAYSQLMDAYDEAEGKYDTIKTRAEKLKDSLRDKIQTTYQYGVLLPNGEVAFYDSKNANFVDGTTLQPLQGDDANIAAKEFSQLPAEQQKANACYVDACAAYDNAASISRVADAGGVDVKNAKLATENSQGSLSEADLIEARKNASVKVDSLSARLDKAEDTNADLDAALGVDQSNAGPAISTVSPVSSQTSQGQPLSFASQIDPNAITMGGGNGKTASSFNAAAGAVAAVESVAPNSQSENQNYRPPLAPAF